MSAPTTPRTWTVPEPPGPEIRGLGDRYRRLWERVGDSDRWRLVSRVAMETQTFAAVFVQGWPLRDATAELPVDTLVGEVALWAVDHPGIGVLEYDSESFARQAAGTAGILLTRGSANEPWQQVAL